ncbi:MAG: tRNA (adenosine(37)-N6)-dimethylallyltransferase MiaA [Tepidisphaeraceae bacterium]
MADVPPILVLLGPTASGKSALALRLAERVGGEILSIDSMQVYRGMDIGTAKPTPDEQRQVRHHLIDEVDPSESFAVSQFVEKADAVIADARRRAVPLIATGGTPMYYKALFEGLFEGPSADDAVRARLNEQPLEELHARLTQVDPAAADRIHRNDRRRLVRALEVFELTGQPISQQQQQWGSALRHEAAWFGLQWEKEALNRRINARVKQMIAAGWVDETRELLTRFNTLSKTAAEATGYHELIEFLHGRMPLEDAVEQIKIATRQLSRRQVKWFRRWSQIHWLDAAALASVESQADAILAAIAQPPAPSLPTGVAEC